MFQINKLIFIVDKDYRYKYKVLFLNDDFI